MNRINGGASTMTSTTNKTMSQQTYEKINRSLALSMQQQKTQLAKAQRENVMIRADNQRLSCRIRQLEIMDDNERFTFLLNEAVEVVVVFLLSNNCFYIEGNETNS